MRLRGLLLGPTKGVYRLKKWKLTTTISCSEQKLGWKIKTVKWHGGCDFLKYSRKKKCVCVCVCVCVCRSCE